MRNRRWIAGFMVTVALALGVVAGTAATRAQLADKKTPDAVEVQIDNFSFSPMDLTIAAGTTVTWTNHDDVPHVVAGDGKTFKSQVLDTDDRYSYTFAKAGTYNYYCTVHPKMTAKIVVR